MDVGSLYDVVYHYTHHNTTPTATEEYEADVDEALAELYDALFPTNLPAPDQPNPLPPVISTPPPPPVAATATTTTTHREKKEEWSQQLLYWKKRVEKKKKTTYMVPAANLAVMDGWVWRKYGRKPVKGSSFLRSYYKCTSADGCNARKHVEKSLVEPEVYLVAYIGEHTHSSPAHCSEPAGSGLSGQTAGFPVRDNAPSKKLAPPAAPPIELPPLPEGMENLQVDWMGFGDIGSGSGSYGPGFY